MHTFVLVAWHLLSGNLIRHISKVAIFLGKTETQSLKMAMLAGQRFLKRVMAVHSCIDFSL